MGRVSESVFRSEGSFRDGLSEAAPIGKLRTVLSIGYQAMKAIATFLVTWYNYFSRRFFLEGAQ